MTRPASNVVRLRKRAAMVDDSKDKLYQAFRDQEPEINELEKLADLALYICDQETMAGVEISGRGATAVVVVEQLRDRIATFRKDYYEKYKT
jgi:hypothetical protein